MFKAILLKILYYLFFTVIIIFAAILFLKITDNNLYSGYLAVFFEKILGFFQE
ncbi:MAG: hypothetical protein JW770_01830 [Actinobacteria bacterium]|nr:hypothetical protein [Actinomycetota bacterium]